MIIAYPKCQTKLQAPEGAEGKTIRCPKCQATLQVPQAVVPPPPPVVKPAEPEAAPSKKETKAKRYKRNDSISSSDLPHFGRERGRVTMDSTLFLMLMGGSVLFGLAGIFGLIMSLFREEKLAMALVGAGSIFVGSVGSAVFYWLHRQMSEDAWIIMEKGIVERAGEQYVVVVWWDDVLAIKVDYARSAKIADVLAYCTIDLVMKDESVFFSTQEFNTSALSELLFWAYQLAPMGNENSLVTALREGSPRRIGPFTVRPDGISWKDQHYSWNQVRGVSHQIFSLVLDLVDGSSVDPEVIMLGFESAGEFFAAVRHFTSERLAA